MYSCRGYVFDVDTGLYYLQSRYYDPAKGRFINADAFASTGQGTLGNNMFAYCLNQPCSYRDSSGQFAVPIPTLTDFYNFHKEVQKDCQRKYGFKMEVRVSGPKNGKPKYGRLDLYDPSSNMYYEVKSIGAAYTNHTKKQMQMYDNSVIASVQIPDCNGMTPDRGSEYIHGKCTYGMWDITYQW